MKQNNLTELEALFFGSRLANVLTPTFVLVLLFMLSSQDALSQITRADAKLAMQCYNGKFYNQYGTYGTSYKAMYYANTNRNSRSFFWWEVESIETQIDAYIINNDADFKNKIRYLYNGIRDGYGLTWANNKFNDDLIWGAIMCIRAFQIHNDGGMKDMAINNFNIVWNRAWDTSLGGGLWWTTDRTSKNACVNGPAAICAMYLYYATGDVNYRNKAKQIMDWMRSRLYNTTTGEVKGAINSSGVITEGSRTYTQGTFIGAAGELQKYYAADNWLAIGRKAMDYTKNVMSNSSGLLPDEYCGVDDCPGFKGIFARWACKFVKDYGLTSTYGSWLNYNARQAWTYRNSSGLMWAQWWRRTPDAFLTSWETTSGVSMMNNVFLYNAGSTARENIEVIDDVTTSDERLLRIHPIPVNRTLRFENSEIDEGLVHVMNINGSVVLVQRINNRELDLESLPTGVYTIVAEKDGVKYQSRFIKE